MKTYYIYHIPTYKWKSGKIGKVGCTDDLINRMYSYPKNTVYEVLESYSDVFIASDREILLQRRYGYPVDKIPYWKTIQMVTKENCSKGGKIGGKIGGKKHVESGHLAMIREARKRPILQYHKDGTFIKEWSSVVEAGNELNLNKPSITKACQCKYKTTGGFVFKYKEGNVC
jgi:hypothetical protein